MIVIVVYVVGIGVASRRQPVRTRSGQVPNSTVPIGPQPTPPRLGDGNGSKIAPQAIYAFARARVDLRLTELVDALDRHEADPANWARFELLDRIEGVLGGLAEEIEKP